MSPRLGALLCLCALLLASGVSSEHGICSWYGPEMGHNARTASGEMFNWNDLTAAHKTLPFGTRIKVVNKKNQRSVVVRINDRGPFTAGRIVDLSLAAAREIGMVNDGIVPCYFDYA